MATSQPSLDPRKTPWKRGDVCTLGFKETCFVLNFEDGYLDVRWNSDKGIERIPPEEVDNLVRIAHADSLGPDGVRTNLQYLETIESLSRVKQKLTKRIEAAKSDKEVNELNDIMARVFVGDGCEWDKKHGTELLVLITDPQSVGILFKIRDRIHRVFCRHRRHKT